LLGTEAPVGEKQPVVGPPWSTAQDLFGMDAIHSINHLFEEVTETHQPALATASAIGVFGSRPVLR